MVLKTYDPIITEKKGKRSFFERLPVPDQGRAILLSSTISNLNMVCITRNTNIQMRELNFRKYDHQIEIDLSPHDIYFENEVTSRDSVSKFLVKVSASARVSDPEKVYQEQIRDVGQQVERYLLEVIRERAASCRMEEGRILSQDLKQYAEQFRFLENGIELRNIHFDVQMDEKYREHIEKIKEINYTTDLERNKALASKVIQELYPDSDVAAFSEVAAGKIGASDAIRQIKAGRSQDFDEKVRQFNAAMKILNDLGDTVDDPQKEIIAKSFLNTMVPSSAMVLEQGKQVSGILEDRGTKTDNRYRSFDIDED